MVPSGALRSTRDTKPRNVGVQESRVSFQDTSYMSEFRGLELTFDGCTSGLVNQLVSHDKLVIQSHAEAALDPLQSVFVAMIIAIRLARFRLCKSKVSKVRGDSTSVHSEHLRSGSTLVWLTFDGKHVSSRRMRHLQPHSDTPTPRQVEGSESWRKRVSS